MKKTRQLHRSISLVAALSLVAAPILAFAADEKFPTISLNLTYPSFGGFNLATDQNLVQIIGWLYYAIVTISGLAAFVMLMYGGIQWLTSSGNPGQITQAKSRMGDALLGLALVLGSYIILTIINPGLTTLQQPSLETVKETGIGGYSGSQEVCAPPPADSACSPNKTPELKEFGSETTNASIVCYRESSRKDESWALNDNCLRTKDNAAGGDDYSVGLFQINLLAHCKTSSGASPFQYPINDPASPGKCKIIDQEAVNACLDEFGYGNASKNIQKAIQIRRSVSTWYPTWGAAGACSNIPK